MLEAKRGEGHQSVVAAAVIRGQVMGEDVDVIKATPSGATRDLLGAFAGDDDDLADVVDYPLAPPVIDVADVSLRGAPGTESADTGWILRAGEAATWEAGAGAPPAAQPGASPGRGDRQRAEEPFNRADLRADLRADSADRASTLGAYRQELRRHALLTRDEEHRLAVHFSRTGDSAASRRLITANLRLVVKISQEYRRSHKNLLDLIQEGNIGLIQAVQKYDPYRGVKLSSYAAWWIRAYILKFILTNWRMVKIGTTQAQRKLFFTLRREREKLEKSGFEVETRHLAAALDVSEREILDMERRLGLSETSLDAPVRGDELGGRTQGDFVPAAASTRPDVQVELGEFQELLRQHLEAFGATLKDRELDIFRDRLLSDAPTTLQELGERHGVSRERARQIEERLKKKLRNFLRSRLGDAVGMSNQAKA